MQNTNLFTSDLGARLDKYVQRRNKLVHGLFVEHFQDRKDIQVESRKGKEYADYCGWLIEEGAALIEVSFGVAYITGLALQKQGIADPDSLRILDEFKEYHHLGFSHFRGKPKASV